MKKLSIEEKAKHYDEALERAKEINNEQKAQPFNIMLKVFPELKESEDERIRKAIIRHFQTGTEYISFSGLSKSKILSWLEKQGNINPTEDELEALRIAAYEPTKNWSEKLQSLYEKLTHCEQGEQKPACSEEQHKKESLSDIENRIINFAMQFHDNRMKPEAEWEDELKMLRDNIKIDPWSEEDEKMLNDIIMCGEHHCYLDAGNIAWLKFFKDRVLSKQEWSERDELMFEASISFIKSSPYPYFGDTLRGEISKIEAENWIKFLKDRVQLQPNPAWSEEDKKMFVNIKACLRNANKDYSREVDWLIKSIKFQPKNKWSEEDESILSHIINNLKFLKDTISIDPNYIVNITDIEREINWLNSLRDRVQPQPKQEWSEEDDNCLSTIIAEFSKCAGKSVSKDEWMRCNDFLNSLRDRVQSPAKQEWSEKDKKILDGVITNYESGYLPSVEKRDEIIEKLESLKERYT